MTAHECCEIALEVLSRIRDVLHLSHALHWPIDFDEVANLPRGRPVRRLQMKHTVTLTITSGHSSRSGVTATFSVILAARGLWSLRRSYPASRSR